MSARPRSPPARGRRVRQRRTMRRASRSLQIGWKAANHCSGCERDRLLQPGGHGARQRGDRRHRRSPLSSASTSQPRPTKRSGAVRRAGGQHQRPAGHQRQRGRPGREGGGVAEELDRCPSPAGRDRATITTMPPARSAFTIRRRARDRGTISHAAAGAAPRRRNSNSSRGSDLLDRDHPAACRGPPAGGRMARSCRSAAWPPPRPRGTPTASAPSLGPSPSRRSARRACGVLAAARGSSGHAQ